MSFVRNVFGKNVSVKTAPFVIINKDADIIEFNCIESAIAELEKDPNIPDHKMDKIRASFEDLKNKGTIKIRNGEIIE